MLDPLLPAPPDRFSPRPRAFAVLVTLLAAALGWVVLSELPSVEPDVSPVPALQPVASPVLQPFDGPRPPSRSRYMAWTSGVLADDLPQAERLGCEHARSSAPGLVLLGYGRQVDGGATGFSKPVRPRSYEFLAHLTAGFAKGLASCAPSDRWAVAPMTSNHRFDELSDPARGRVLGELWAEMVSTAAELAEPFEVMVFGSFDLEPGWSSPPPAVAWVEGYAAASGPTLVFAASADGCPFERSGDCLNGWSSSSLARTVWGVAPSSVALPQVYRPDARMAMQWAALARTALELGLSPFFAGALSQDWACEVSSSKDCDQLSLSAVDAQAQLFEQLELAGVPVGFVQGSGSDIGWG